MTNHDHTGKHQTIARTVTIEELEARDQREIEFFLKQALTLEERIANRRARHGRKAA